MGVGVPGEGGLDVSSVTANDEDDEGDEEEELTVHHTASTGDMEVWGALNLFSGLCINTNI